MSQLSYSGVCNRLAARLEFRKQLFSWNYNGGPEWRGLGGGQFNRHVSIIRWTAGRLRVS
jgi:hypothetical protein